MSESGALMEYHSVIYELIADPKKIKNQEFRTKLINSVSHIVVCTYQQMFQYLNEPTDIQGSDVDKPLETLSERAENSNIAYGPHDTDFADLKKFFKILADYALSNDKETISLFERVFNDQIFGSFYYVYLALHTIEDCKTIIENSQSEQAYFTVQQYIMAFHKTRFLFAFFDRVYEFHQHCQDLEMNDDMSSLFVPLITNNFVQTLEVFLKGLKSNFLKNKDNPLYTKKMYKICSNLQTEYTSGILDQVLAAYIYGQNTSENEQRRIALFNNITNIRNEIGNFFTQYIVPAKADLDRKKSQRHLEEWTRDDGSSLLGSSDQTIHNQLDLIVGDDLGDMDLKEGEAFEHDYIKRLAKENQKKLDAALEKFQEQYDKKLSKKSQRGYQKQEFIYNPGQQIDLDTVFFQIINNQIQQNSFVFSTMPVGAIEMQNILNMNKVNCRVVQLNTPAQQISYIRGYVIGNDGSIRTTGGTGNSYIPRGRIIQGPKPTTLPLSFAGKVASGYIGAFIVVPTVYKDMKVIVSHDTKAGEKAAAALDLGIMAGSMYTFTKLIANKHPKIASAIMIFTAGKHMLENGLEIYENLENGKTKSHVFYLNEQAYLKSGVSCVDGRKPIFLEYLDPNHAKQSNSFLSIRKK